MKLLSRCSLAALTLILIQQAQANTPKKVRIDFIEPLGQRETTSSERFLKEYEGAIELGKNLLSKKLSNCGYTLETKTLFYEANDSLKAKELAGTSSADGAWLLVGPRRSNHYLLLAQGAQNTPTVSPMASADDVAKQGKQHISISPTNSQMAKIAAKEAKSRRGSRATYITVVSDDCVNCVDFSKAFDLEAKHLGLKKLEEIAIRGETFDVEPIHKSVLAKAPQIILLPNYSKASSVVMAALNDMKNAPLFIGGDGWGDNRYGFVQTGQQIQNAKGLTVRGFPPLEQGLQDFTLGKQVVKREGDLPFSGTAMGLLKILDSISDLLCSSRPSSKADFLKSFEKKAAKSLRAPWGVSIYDLKAGEIVFNRKQKVH